MCPLTHVTVTVVVSACVTSTAQVARPSACSTAKASISPSASTPNAVKLKAIAKLGAEEQEHEELWWKWLGGAALFSESLYLPGNARRGFAVGLSQELRLPAAPGAELFLGTHTG